MFNTYDEAKTYAMQRVKEESGYIGIILTKNNKYNVAKDYDEADYASVHGWTIVK